MEVLQARDIGDQVLRGMQANATRSEALIRARLPRFLHAPGRDFAGVPGSRVYEALRQGAMSYRSWSFLRRDMQPLDDKRWTLSVER